MILKKASFHAVKYACFNFHYAKRLPAQHIEAFSCFENNKWCGVVVFNKGIGKIESPFNLEKGEVYELTRVALNGKQNKTSQVVSRCVKLFKKAFPQVKLLVSYADTDKGHTGIIYKAMNWVHVGTLKTGDEYIDKKGKSIHSRSHSKTGYTKQFGVIKKGRKTKDLIRIKKGVKHKFIYSLKKELNIKQYASVV